MLAARPAACVQTLLDTPDSRWQEFASSNVCPCGTPDAVETLCAAVGQREEPMIRGFLECARAERDYLGHEARLDMSIT